MHQPRLNRRRLVQLPLAGVPVAMLGVSSRHAVGQDATETPEGELVPVETPAGGAAGGEELSGTVVISFQGNDTQTWQALGDAYTALHPNVEVKVELKPAEGYQEFIRAADLMRYEAARLFDRGQSCGAEANMAKMLAADASWEAANVCLQTHGGFGFATEYDV